MEIRLCKKSLCFVAIALLVWGTGYGETNIVDKDHPDWALSVSADTLRIVAFGNSITAERKTVDQVFAQRIPGLLAREGIDAAVINSGIGGSHTGRRTDHDLFKIEHGMDRFQSDVVAHAPDLVVIGFGTNDSYIDSKTPDGPSRIPLEKYQANLKYFITNLQDQGAEIVLIAPNILGANYGDFQNKRLLKYVKVVRKLARRFDTGLVDNYKLFQDYAKQHKTSYEELMLDGCHPNDKGHALIAQHLAVEISKRINAD